MKPLLFITSFLLGITTIPSQAQTAKTKKVNLADRSQLVYEVAEDGKTKSGTYVVNNRDNKELWMQGYYKDDNRVGTWTFFNAKYEPTLRYNYDQKKITYINNDSFKDVDVKILNSDSEVVKGASIPIPLCSLDEYVSLVSSKVYAMYDNIHDNLAATVTAHVDKDGNATYTISYPSSNGKIQNFKIAIDNSQFKINWIPSHYHNNALDADFSVVVNITPNDVERWHRFRWDI